MATDLSDNKQFLTAVKKTVKEILKPWEILCGMRDTGFAYVPDIECKTPEDFDKHIDRYMDADIPAIDKKTGEIRYVPWDDEDFNGALKDAKYIKIQEPPEYTKQ